MKPNQYQNYGNPWWKDRSREYKNHSNTNILETFLKMGWKPPSKQQPKEK